MLIATFSHVWMRQYAISGMESRRAQYLADRFGGKFVQLSESMIEKTLKVNQLVDMEWRFGGLSLSICTFTRCVLVDLIACSLVRVFYCNCVLLQ